MLNLLRPVVTCTPKLFKVEAEMMWKVCMLWSGYHAVADQEGVRGGSTAWSPNYFIFIGNSGKMCVKWSN